MICIICNKEITGAKGMSSHLRYAHALSNKEYYDSYLKTKNEGICPICNSPTKFYSLTRGYLNHCSVKCSSSDPNVQNKLQNTCMSKYGVSYGTQLKKTITNSHSKSAMNKRHQTKVKNGWCRSKLEEFFIEKMIESNIEYKHNYLSDKYPWKCDFYIPSKDLYIEINGYWTHGFHFYDSNDEKDLKRLMQLNKSVENHKHSNIIKIWTEYDLKKRATAIENNLNYIVVWNIKQLKQLIYDIQTKQLTGLIDYNYVSN